MRKLFISFFLFIFISSGIFCESPLLQTYLQRFVRADLLAKIELLYEVYSNSEAAHTGFSQNFNSSYFYEYAVQFVLDNYAQIDDLRDMNTIINISLNGILQEYNKGNIESKNINSIINVLWKLFLEYPDSHSRAEVIITLGLIGKEDQILIDKINSYLMELNLLFRSGENVDYSIISACISALMELGNSSSYPVLFSIICSDFPEVLASESYGALELIPGNLQQFLLNIIENNPPDEKFAAFKAVINSNRLSIPERGLLAELALAQSLLSSEDDVYLSAMRYTAVLLLTNLRWTRANALAIRHYYRVQADYSQDIVPKERFLEAISCLGSVGNSDAALVLVLQLGLINLRTENTGNYDAEITLSIVQSLGLIGDNAAFNHLTSVTKLPYNEDIIAAAKEAITRLKW